jgi:hypothetical protein
MDRTLEVGPLDDSQDAQRLRRRARLEWRHLSRRYTAEVTNECSGGVPDPSRMVARKTAQGLADRKESTCVSAW